MKDNIPFSNWKIIKSLEVLEILPFLDVVILRRKHIDKLSVRMSNIYMITQILYMAQSF